MIVNKKLFLEHSSDFLPAEKPSFFQRNKDNILIGSAGLLGAGALSYLGGMAGEDYGENAHKEHINELKNNLTLNNERLTDTNEKLKILSNFNPSSQTPIDEKLIDSTEISKIKDNLKNELNRIITNPNATEEQVALAYKNYNAQLTRLYDVGNTNLKFGGDFRTDGEIKDLFPSLKKDEPSFLKRLVSNDDLSNPNQENIKNRAAIDALVKNANNLNDIRETIPDDPDKIREYNSARVPALENKFNKNIEYLNKENENIDKNLNDLNSPEKFKETKNKFKNIGLATGGILGGLGAAAGTYKLNNLAKDYKQKQEEIRNNELNSYGQKL